MNTQEACEKIFAYLAIENSISSDLRETTQRFIASIPRNCTFSVPKAKAALGRIKGAPDFEGCYELEECLEEIASKLRQAGENYYTLCSCPKSKNEHVLEIFRIFVELCVEEEIIIALRTVVTILAEEKATQFLEAHYRARPSDN